MENLIIKCKFCGKLFKRNINSYGTTHMLYDDSACRQCNEEADVN